MNESIVANSRNVPKIVQSDSRYEAAQTMRNKDSDNRDHTSNNVRTLLHLCSVEMILLQERHAQSRRIRLQSMLHHYCVSNLYATFYLSDGVQSNKTTKILYSLMVDSSYFS